MEEIKVKSLIKFVILTHLHEKPISGYDIIKSIKQKTGETTSPGTVYSFLKELKLRGYIHEIGSIDTGNFVKIEYRLTDKGQILLNNTYNKINGFSGKLRYKCIHCDVEFIQRKVNLMHNFCCKACENEFHIKNYLSEIEN